MDTLTFGTNILLRHLTFSEARKMPIKEFYLDKVEYLNMFRCKRLCRYMEVPGSSLGHVF